MQKIITFLWFNDQAEEATNFYVSLFKNSKVIGMNRMGPGGPVFSTSFELEGQTFYALNGGPKYKFTPRHFFVCELLFSGRSGHTLGQIMRRWPGKQMWMAYR